MASKPTLAVVLGTRPEVIKLALAVAQLRKTNQIEVQILATGQHRELAIDAFAQFGLRPEFDFQLMKPQQTPQEFLALALPRIAETLTAIRADAVLVQGDTASAFAGALAGFQLGLPVLHLEAGLRTWNLAAPFPEEGYRQCISRLASFHLAPTEAARSNLLREGARPESVVVTGNTIVSALAGAGVSGGGPEKFHRPSRRLLVTLHRRESHGEKLRGVLSVLRQFADQQTDIQIRFPVHPNPAVTELVREFLDKHPRITLLPPLGHAEFLSELSEAFLVVTDSGGVQEEAPSFGIPVLVAREVTDRPESVTAGIARLVGLRPEVILSALQQISSDSKVYASMCSSVNPFGAPDSAEKAASAIEKYLASLSAG